MKCSRMVALLARGAASSTFPMESPPTTEHTTPTTLHTRVLSRTTSGILTPFR